MWRLLGQMGGEISVETAMCLYAGLVTDTGRFQYAAVGPDTLRLAAELREFPFDHTRLVQALYEDNRIEYLRLLGLALERVRLEPDADLVWTYLTRADLAAAEVHPSETDDLIDVIRTAREADVAAVIKQQHDGRFKVSLRSRGDHDVATVAAGFGGGGHRLAAGYTSAEGLAGTVEKLKVALGEDPRPGRGPRRWTASSWSTNRAGMTSHDVVDEVRRELGTRRVGHAGTLDPMATGLLLLGVGRATRLLRYFGDLPKTYEGSARLGQETDTLDADGTVVRTAAVDATRPVLDDAVAALVGESMQRPPAYSAVKVGGRKLYEAARAGETLEAPPRPVRVDAFRVTVFDPPVFDFEVTCSGGTYVRVLVADVGAALGCGASPHPPAPDRDRPVPRRGRGRCGGPRPARRMRSRTCRGWSSVPRKPRRRDMAASSGRRGSRVRTALYARGRLIGVYRDDGAKARPEVVLATG